jgi:hypothetical protein
MKKMIFVLMLSLAALAGCNDNEQGLAQSVDNDWVQDPIVVNPDPNDPSPSPTPIPTPTDQVYTGPAELNKYVVKFIDDAKIQGIDVLPDMNGPKLEVRIASLDAYGSSTIGLCETSSTRRRVTFDPDFWNSVSETQRELLAHHELGHCVLYRGHRSDLLSTGKYASIMYPIIMGSAAYTSNYDYYQEELFTQAVQSTGQSQDNVHICDIEGLTTHE